MKRNERKKENKSASLTASQWARLSAGGFAAGVVGGSFGNGGGVIVILLLTAYSRLLFDDGRQVLACASAAIAPMSLVSAVVYGASSFPSLSVIIPIGVAALVGGGAGAFLLGRLSSLTLRNVFGAIMVASGIMMLAA